MGDREREVGRTTRASATVEATTPSVGKSTRADKEPHDDPSNPIRHAFWIATYDGDLSGLDAAKAEIRRRAQSGSPSDVASAVEVITNRLYDLKKLHDNVKLHKPGTAKDWVDEHQFVSTINMLNAKRLLAGDEKRIILDAFSRYLHAGGLKGTTNPTADVVLDVARIVLRIPSSYASQRNRVAEAYRPALDALYDARFNNLGSHVNPLDAGQRLARLEAAMQRLAPLLAKHPDPVITEQTASLREELVAAGARAQVDGAAADAANPAPELSKTNTKAEEEAKQLRTTIKETASALRKIVKIGLKVVKAEQLNSSLIELSKEVGTVWPAVGTVEDVLAVLELVDGLLAFGDEKFQTQLATLHAQGLPRNIATLTKLVQESTKVIVGTIKVIATLTALINKIGGNAALAKEAAELGRKAGGGTFGKAVSIIGIVHGLSVLVDKTSTNEEKDSAILEVALAGGSLAGTPVYLGVWVAYWELRLTSQIYVGGRSSITNMYLSRGFLAMERAYASIRHEWEGVYKAFKAFEHEPNPEKKRAFEQVAREKIAAVASVVNDFLSRCRSGNPMTDYDLPGAFRSLRRVFKPLVDQHAIPDDPVETQKLAKEVLEKIAECFKPDQRAALEKEEAGLL